MPRNRCVGIYYEETNMGSAPARSRPYPDPTARGRAALESELRHAVEAGELELHYQPRLCLRTGRLCGAEALVRWRTAEHGVLLPDDFIPVAEQTGLIAPLWEWVVDTACRHASAAWCTSQGLPLLISVNLSPTQLCVPHPADMLQAVLTRHVLAPERLEIELTESALMADVHCATVSLVEIVELGVRLALDDFGTGYSSLGLLARLPVSTLKIARPLVTDIAGSSRDAVIVRNIIRMAHELGIEVVAEGVETESQFAVLQRSCCDELQGYLIGKPLGAAAFAAWLRRWNGSAVAAGAEAIV
jgi:EAL domain-containing protein (putative c-di-GMP-specific phosphodiesterase class I)